MSKFFSFPSERFSDTYHTNSTILNNIDSNIKTIILIKCIYCIISKNSPTELLFFSKSFIYWHLLLLHVILVACLPVQPMDYNSCTRTETSIRWSYQSFLGSSELHLQLRHVVSFYRARWLLLRLTLLYTHARAYISAHILIRITTYIWTLLRGKANF